MIKPYFISFFVIHPIGPVLNFYRIHLCYRDISKGVSRGLPGGSDRFTPRNPQATPRQPPGNPLGTPWQPPIKYNEMAKKKWVKIMVGRKFPFVEHML
jgi:hypothetical protein